MHDENIIVDIISRQYYGDINLYALIDKDEKNTMVKNLNQYREPEDVESIVCDTGSRNRVFDNLYKS